MAEYIEREKVVEYLTSRKSEFIDDYGKGWSAGVGTAIGVCEKFPAADVAPVVHGRWENYPSHAFRRCSACKVEWEKPRFNIRANYCPNCGAKMDAGGGE